MQVIRTEGHYGVALAGTVTAVRLLAVIGLA